MNSIPDPADFLAAISGAAQPDLPPGSRLATIDPAYNPFVGYPASLPLPRVTFDGETTLSVKQYPVTAGYLPLASDRVLMVPSGRTYVIIGSVTDPSPTFHANTTLLTSSGILVPLDGAPRARAHLTGNQPAAHDPTFPGNNVSWTSSATVDYNQQVTFSAGAPTVFTIQVPGTYRMLGTVIYAASNVGLRYAGIIVNGVQIVSRIDPSPTSLFACSVHVDEEMFLAAGATVALGYLQNSGSTLNMQGGSTEATRLVLSRVSS